MFYLVRCNGESPDQSLAQTNFAYAEKVENKTKQLIEVERIKEDIASMARKANHAAVMARLNAQWKAANESLEREQRETREIKERQRREKREWAVRQKVLADNAKKYFEENLAREAREKKERAAERAAYDRVFRASEASVWKKPAIIIGSGRMVNSFEKRPLRRKSKLHLVELIKDTRTIKKS